AARRGDPRPGRRNRPDRSEAPRRSDSPGRAPRPSGTGDRSPAPPPWKRGRGTNEDGTEPHRRDWGGVARRGAGRLGEDDRDRDPKPARDRRRGDGPRRGGSNRGAGAGSA